MTGRAEKSLMCNADRQGYEELKWGISKLNPLCNGSFGAKKGGRSTAH